MSAPWGGPSTLSAWESLMWRAEGDRRTRSTGVLLELLDSEPDWDRVRAAHRRLTAGLPRLRERIVTPPVPLVEPGWSLDPEFDLDYHLTRLRLPGAGDLTDLLGVVSTLASRPIDRSRPPWEAYLITGLSGGRAAYAFKVHHALSDGAGLVQLLSTAHSRTAEPGDHEEVERAGHAPTGPLALLARGVTDGAAHAPGAVLETARRSAGALAAGLRDPAGSGRAVLGYVDSLRRMLTPPPAERSPLLRDGGPGLAHLVHDVPFDRLRAAGRAAGGSLNDAFLAGVLGSFRRWHDRRGVVPELMPLAFPVSTRRADDPEGGNHFAGARFAAPLREPDPRARIAAIGAFVRAVREEPAIGFLEVLAPVLSGLPTPAVVELSASLVTASDVQASNIPGLTEPVYLAGARVTGVYPLGPRPGVAAMVTLLTYAGTCCLGITLDPAVVPDVREFATCVEEGFAEVLALAPS